MSNEELENLPETDPRHRAWEEAKEGLRNLAEKEVAAIHASINKKLQQEAANDNND